MCQCYEPLTTPLKHRTWRSESISTMFWEYSRECCFYYRPQWLPIFQNTAIIRLDTLISNIKI